MDIKKRIDLLLHKNEKLQSLLHVSESIMSEMHLDALLQKIMIEVTKVMDADRSTLFILDKKSNELWSKVAQGAGIGEIRFPSTMGIAGHVATSGETVNIVDAYGDDRFNQAIDKKTGYKTKGILTMAMTNAVGDVMGVMQVLNKKGDVDYFTPDDEELLRAFSSIAAISLENAIIYEQVHNTMKIFELFVPKKFLDRIAVEGMESIKLGSANEEKVSVLFSDIRSFTTISEPLTADETLIFLNSYMKRMAGVVSKYDGFVDKFIGDAIMAIFDQKTSNNCVRAALAMREELELYNKMRNKKGFEPIDIGIGINTGLTIIGTIGTNERMDSTVIGDAVNLASRLEGLTKLYNTPILISEDTFEDLEDKEKYWVREIDSVIVKGRKGTTSIYEVFNCDQPKVRDMKMQSGELIKKGRTLYCECEWDGAIDYFQQALSIYPVDMVAKTFIKRCETYKKIPPADNWDGSYRLDVK